MVRARRVRIEIHSIEARKQARHSMQSLWIRPPELLRICAFHSNVETYHNRGSGNLALVRSYNMQQHDVRHPCLLKEPSIKRLLNAAHVVTTSWPTRTCRRPSATPPHCPAQMQEGSLQASTRCRSIESWPLPLLRSCSECAGKLRSPTLG